MKLSHEWFVHQRALRLLERYLESQLAPPDGYRVAVNVQFRKGGA